MKSTKIKTQGEKVSDPITTNWREAYNAIVHAAANKARTDIMQRSMAGMYPPSRLCYRRGELLLSPECPEGFIDSGLVMPITVEYQRIGEWIYDNAGRLSIF